MESLESYLDRIICGDALEVMSQLPSGSIDVVVTSPPYNLRETTGGMRHDSYSSGKRWSSMQINHGYDTYADKLPYPEYVAWQRACLTEMLRLVPETGAVFYNHKWRVQGGLLQDRHEILDGFPVRQIIIWQRAGGINFNDYYFVPTYEVIYLIAKPKFRLLPTRNKLGDIWYVPQETHNPHPAPFPVGIPYNILTSVPFEVCLDPFMGSGTTAVVVQHLGKHYIGIDVSPAYVQMAEERLVRNKDLDEVAYYALYESQKRGRG